MDEYLAMPTIKEGDSSNVVQILQDKLKILDYFAATPNGSFGPNTKLAVINFQNDYGLEPTGIVGKETWKLLFNLTSIPFPNRFRQINPTLKLGDTGAEVTRLQTILQELLYYNGPISGTFDEATQSAVKNFQKTNKLTADGIVGRNTWSALSYLYSPLANCEGEDPNLTNPENPEPVKNTYTVIAGDTLWSIANKFGLTVDELKTINNLTSNTISIGQKLIVNNEAPSPNDENPIYHTVVSGDTLWSLSRKYNISVDDIKKANNLTSDSLSIGQNLIIPSNYEEETPEEYINYTVKKGDTLYGIARTYNTTVDEIKRINNLKSISLSIGQNLKLPKISTSSKTLDYVVKVGDTLYSIARNFNTTVTELTTLNNLTTNLLTVGQIIKIFT